MLFNIKNIFFAVILIATVVLAAKYVFRAAPKEQIVHNQESGYRFYYYPKLNLYYDVSKNNFIYSVDGGHSWITRKPTSEQAPEKIGERVVFYSPVPDTWMNNAEHRDRYKGVLTSYVEKPEDTATLIVDTNMAKKKKPAKKSAAKSSENEKKEEDRKKGFFKRLGDKLKKKMKKEEV